MNMSYALEVFIASIIFYAGYRAIVHFKATFGFRRLYLAVWLLFTCTLPLLEVNLNVIPTVSYMDVMTFDSTDGRNSPQKAIEHKTEESVAKDHPLQASNTEANFSYTLYTLKDYLFLGYWLLTFFFLARLGFAIYKVFSLKWTSKSDYSDGIPILRVGDVSIVGATFFKWIFIGDNVPNENVVLHHECTHRELGHSWDIIAGELYTCFFWWNPFAWLLRKYIRVNTEFQCDQRSSSYFGKEFYGESLLDLAIVKSNGRVAVGFSDIEIRSRIMMLVNAPVTNRQWLPLTLLLSILLSFAVVACRDSVEVVGEGLTLENVKTITTRFESHQGDTKQKDHKIVAVANILPDGSLDNVVQHMTYPYDYEHSFDREFWTQPDLKNLSHIMDGLDLGDAEKNLLYGNDWPVVFEQFVKDNGHPRHSRIEDFESKVEVVSENNLPKQISIYPEGNGFPSSFGTYIDEFEYLNNRVISHRSHGYLSGHVMKDKQLKVEKMKVNLAEVVFQYENENIVRVATENRVFKFSYEADKLSHSEFYVDGKLYSTRKYSYNDSGLKSKTEVTNVFGQPEYTIYYEYTFYE